MERKRRKTLSHALCTLVADNQCNPENIEKFKKLVSEGANINFKNTASDDDTPLHLAVKTQNSEWIRLLLEHEADATILNNIGKRSIELATDLDNTEIVSLIMKRVRKIDKKFVKEIEFSDKEWTKNVESYRNQTCKILKIRNCKTFSQAVQFMSQSCFNQNFNDAPFFFVIIIENLKHEVVDISQLNSIFTKPMIVQITSKDCHSIFYKMTKESLFEYLSIVDSIATDGGILDGINHADQFNFELIAKLQMNQPKIWGKFSYDLLQTEMNVEANIGGVRLIDYAVQHDCDLVLRFLQLFNWDLCMQNENGERVLEIATEFGSLRALKILLDICDDDLSEEFRFSSHQNEALNLLSKRNCSLLMIAAESGNIDVIKLLLKCGADVNYENADKGNSSDIAWREENFDALLEIINADGPFPRSFDANILPPDNSLKTLAEQRNLLHSEIKCQKFNNIQKFVEENPQIKRGYSPTNHCMLSTALRMKAFEIYSFLRSQGFSSGIDSGYYGSHLDCLSTLEKQQIRDANKKYFKAADNVHIMDLLSKSRLGFGSEQKHFKKIKSFYEKLDEIPEVQPILKIVANAKTVKIIFDFNRDSIEDVDPTKTVDVRGTAYHMLGHIYIGAKRSSDSEVIGTLAHELTHYAMQLTYGNQCKPFHKSDAARQNEFEDLVKTYSSYLIKSREKIIEGAFQSSSFDVQVAELIVRVPHLLAHYKGNAVKIQELHEGFNELFCFFASKTLVDLENEFPVLKAQRSIQELNKLLGVSSGIEASKIFCNDAKAQELLKIETAIKERKTILITSEVPDLMTANIYRYLKQSNMKNIDTFNIFIRIEQFIDEKYFDYIQETFTSVRKPTMFIVNVNESLLAVGKFKTVFNKLKIKDRLVLLKNYDPTSSAIKFQETFNIDYVWNDLHEESQQEVLSYKLDLQGTSIELKEIVTNDFTVLKQLKIKEILKLNNFELQNSGDEISTMLKFDFYIERKFVCILKEIDRELTLKQFLNSRESNRIEIIADAAGMGKTTTLSFIAESAKKNNSTHWVIFIDLKKHTASYVNDQVNYESVDINDEFFTKKILKIRNEVEQKFFEHFYRSGKLIFLFDGFDEISPNFKIFVLKIVRNIKSTKNCLWITTRLHLAKELEDELHEMAIKLKPFSLEDQIEFLMKYWIMKGSKISKDELETQARQLLEKFVTSIGEKNADFFAIPLQVRMLAEIHNYKDFDTNSAQIQQRLNMFTFYELFFNKLLMNWMEKGPLAKLENLQLQKSSSNLIQIHHKAALDHIFDKTVGTSFGLSALRKPLTYEIVSRVGIILFKEDGGTEFIHQTFAEFLVSDFMFSENALMGSGTALSDFFLKILLEEKFERIRKFLNDKLENSEEMETDIIDRLSEGFEVSLLHEGNQMILQQAVLEEQTALIRFLLTTLRLDVNIKIKLMEHKNKDFNTVFHTAAYFGTLNSFSTLWDITGCFMDANQRNKLLLNTGLRQMNVLQIATSERGLSVLEFILNIAQNDFENNEFKSLFLHKDDFSDTALSRATKYENVQVFKKIWNCFSCTMTSDEQKEFFFMKGFNGRNIMHRAIENINIHVVETILEIAENLLSNYENLKSFIFYQDDSGISLLFVSDLTESNDMSHIFKIIWDFIERKLTEVDQKALWIRCDNFGYNILRLAAMRSDEKLVKTILAISKKLLTVAEFKSFLLAEDEFGNSVFTLVPKDENLEAFRLLWHSMESVTDEEQRKILYNISRKLNIEKDPNFMKKLLKVITETTDNLIEAEELYEIFASENRIEPRSNFLVIKNLFSSIRSSIDISPKFLKDLLLDKNDRGLTAFFIVILHENHERLIEVWQIIDKKFSKDEQKNIIIRSRIEDRNMLITAFTNESDRLVIQSFWKILTDLFTSNEIKDFIFKKDRSGMNIFHYGAHNHFYFNILEWFKCEFGEKELKISLRSKSSYQCTPTLLFSQYGDKKFIATYFDLLEKAFDQHELIEMLLEKDNDDENFLACSVYNKDLESVKLLWTYAQKILNSDELEQLVFQRNDQGKMAFQHGRKRNKNAVEKLRKLIVELYGHKILRFDY